METPKKIRISSDLTFLRILMLFLIAICIYKIADNDPDTDFKSVWEFKIFLVCGVIFLIYFLTLKNIYYSDSNLYLKNLLQKEEVIPFKDIKSIDKQYFVRGLAYKLTYANQEGQICSANLFARSLEKLSKLIESVKHVNPLIEID